MFKFKLNIALVHSISFVCMVRQKQFGDDYQEFRVLRRIKLFAYLEITCEHSRTISQHCVCESQIALYCPKPDSETTIN